MRGGTTGFLAGDYVPLIGTLMHVIMLPIFSCTFAPLTVCTPLRPNWLRILGKWAVRNIISMKSTRWNLLTGVAIVVRMLMLAIPAFERIT
jgi:hypothetical protein